MQADIQVNNAGGITPIAVDEHGLQAALPALSIHFIRKDRTGRRLLPFYRIGKRVMYDLGRVREALAHLEEGGPSQVDNRRRAVSR